jgi:hypothetical protein
MAGLQMVLEKTPQHYSNWQHYPKQKLGEHGKPRSLWVGARPQFAAINPKNARLRLKQCACVT